MSWWQKTTGISLLILLIGCLMLIGVIILLSSSGSSGALTNIIIYSVFPMGIIVLIGVLARARERIDMRGGYSPPAPAYRLQDTEPAANGDDQ